MGDTPIRKRTISENNTSCSCKENRGDQQQWTSKERGVYTHRTDGSNNISDNHISLQSSIGQGHPTLLRQCLLHNTDIQSKTVLPNLTNKHGHSTQYQSLPTSESIQKSTSSNTMTDNKTNHKNPTMTNSGNLAVPPDGGYGWVIVAACAWCSAVVDGTTASYGVFVPAVADHFNVSIAMVSLTPSLFVGCFLILGPLVSLMINELGARVTTIAGAIVVSVSFMISAYVDNIYMFILFGGIIGGLGVSGVFIPANVIAGHYFEKKRGIAMGIACSGAGVGMTIVPVCVALASNEFGWRSGIVVLACFTLNCAVMGALLRPLGSSSPANDSANIESTVSYQEDNFKNELDINLENRAQKELLMKKINSVKERHRTISEPANSINHHYNKYSTDYSMISDYDKHRNISNDNVHQYNSDKLSSSHNIHQSQRLLRLDTFYSGSLKSLPEYTSQPDMTSYLKSVTLKPDTCEPNISTSHCTNLLVKFNKLSEVFDIGICSNLPFLIIALSAFLIQLVYFIPFMFLPMYATSLGISNTAAATLISVAGLANTVGRAVGGGLASVPCVNILHLNNITLILMGVATILLPILCTDYISLVVYAINFGFFLGPFVPLVTLFFVKFLGLEKLNSAYGLLSLVRGITNIVGPPLAGLILQHTNSYKVMFGYAGGVFALSGLVYYLLPWAHRVQEKRDQQKI